MEIYKNHSGVSGVTEYEYGDNCIIVKFSGEIKYLYTYLSAGSENIEHMKKLAQSGNGLNTFISQVVKNRYEAKGTDIIINNPLKDKQIFLSYSWKDNDFANELEQLFTTRGIALIKDTRSLRFKDSIKDFMKKIRKTDYVILLISENYLKSFNCMYEISELVKDEDYKERVIPIVIENANIFTMNGRTKYIVFWQDEFKKEKKLSDTLDELNKAQIIEKLKKIERIERDLPEFMEIISDMKSITCNETIDNNKFKDIWGLLYEMS